MGDYTTVDPLIKDNAFQCINICKLASALQKYPMEQQFLIGKLPIYHPMDKITTYSSYVSNGAIILQAFLREIVHEKISSPEHNPEGRVGTTKSRPDPSDKFRYDDTERSSTPDSIDQRSDDTNNFREAPKRCYVICCICGNNISWEYPMCPKCYSYWNLF